MKFEISEECKWLLKNKKGDLVVGIAFDEHEIRNLILAAPEMLEALEAIIKRWDSVDWKNMSHTGEYINRARSVVAKARGKDE